MDLKLLGMVWDRGKLQLIFELVLKAVPHPNSEVWKSPVFPRAKGGPRCQNSEFQILEPIGKKNLEKSESFASSGFRLPETPRIAVRGSPGWQGFWRLQESALRGWRSPNTV
jgi:hypothetical protein